MTKLRGHTQIKVEGWSLNVISHRHPFAPSRPKEGGGNVQNYELSNNARFPSRTKRNRTKISSFSSFFFLSLSFILFSPLLYFASRTFSSTSGRKHSNGVITAEYTIYRSQKGRKRKREREKRENLGRPEILLI